MILLLASGAWATDVDRIFADAESFMPADFTRAMDATQALGPRALPDLLRLVGQSSEPNRVWALCEAIEGLGVADAEVAVVLGTKLDHEAWLVRSACGGAMAATLTAPSPQLLALLRTDPDCPVRRSIARSLTVGVSCGTYYEGLTGSACDQQVATDGLVHCDGAAVLLQVAGDPKFPESTREAALANLRELPPQPQGLSLYRGMVDALERHNSLTYAIELLAPLATAEDRPRLQRVIDTDPWEGEGVHAVAARQALSSLPPAAGR